MEPSLGPAPTQLEPTPASPQPYSGMKHSRKPLVLTIGAVLLLLVIAGGAIAFVMERPKAAPKPTPTPAVVTDDITKALPDIDSSLKEADVNISTITGSLDDIQGDLSE
jgi:hypothetical protein